MHWSLQEAKRQGMPVGRHYCDYLLFLDADQVSWATCRQAAIPVSAPIATPPCSDCAGVACPEHGY
jgi:hypothetical protein